jgi:hypothetical protein
LVKHIRPQGAVGGYRVVVEQQGCAVYDLESGRRVRLPGDKLDRLEQEEAAELVELLNDLDRQQVWRVHRFLGGQ